MIRPVFLLSFISFSIFSAAQTQVSDSILRAHVGALAHDSMMGRLTGSREISMAAQYIGDQMEAIGLQKLTTPADSYLISWILPMNRIIGNHVVGFIPGSKKKDSIIIFSAHYDHIGAVSSQKALPFGSTGSKRVKGDTIFNGANDNATGVAAMLELARYYSSRQPAYTLMFVAFCGEEFGLWGSYDFINDQGPDVINRKKVVLNVNLEMLGRPGKRRPYVTEPPEGSSFLKKLNQNIQQSGVAYPKNYFIRDPYPEQRLFQRSDNFSFYNKGIPAYTIMASDPADPYYHSSADHVETIQFAAMKDIVQAIALGMTPFVLGN